jgi:hypothetical protein
MTHHAQRFLASFGRPVSGGPAKGDRPHPSKWYAPGHYAFVLMNSRPLPFVRWKGALLLRDAPQALLDQFDVNGRKSLVTGGSPLALESVLHE